MTTTSYLRKQAENLTAQRIQWVADAEGYENLLSSMVAEGTHGKRDLDDLRDKIIEADRRANECAEAENHAWAAVAYAEQADHEAWMDEVDNR